MVFKYQIKVLETKLHAISIIVYQEFNDDKLKEQIGEVIWNQDKIAILKQTFTLREIWQLTHPQSL